jgi:hypothetical protein
VTWKSGIADRNNSGITPDKYSGYFGWKFGAIDFIPMYGVQLMAIWLSFYDFYG